MLSYLWVLIVLTAVTVVWVLLAFSRVLFRIEYRRRGQEEWFLLEVTALWGLFRYRIAQPAIKPGTADGASGVHFEATAGKNPERYTFFANFQALFSMFYRVSRRLGRYKRPFFYVWRRMRIMRFEWHTSLGTGDPATTGVACGMLWMVIDFLLNCFSPFLKTPASVSVNPSFFAPLFGTSLHVAVAIDLRHLLGAGISFFYHPNGK